MNNVDDAKENRSRPTIERLTISDYRSCFNTTIKLQNDLSVLIGPNGSGKTNVLTAFLLLRSIARSQGSPPSQIGDEIQNEVQLQATFVASTKQSQLISKIVIENDEHNRDSIVSSKTKWKIPEYSGSNHHLHLPFSLIQLFSNEKYDQLGLFENYSQDKDLTWSLLNRIITKSSSPGNLESTLRIFYEDFKSIYDLLKGMKYYSASHFTNPSLSPISFEVEAESGRRRPVGRNPHLRFLLDLYHSRGTPRYQEFFDIVGPRGIGLIDSIKFKEVPTSSTEYSVKSGGNVRQIKREKMLVIPQFGIGSNELSLSQLSEGTFKTVVLLFYIVTDESTFLMIEEPEVCVHHGLLNSIIEVIKQYSRRKQILVSTHSEFVVDQVESRQVYAVSRDIGQGTAVRHIEETLSKRELAALRSYLENEGNLGEYWRHGGFE